MLTTLNTPLRMQVHLSTTQQGEGPRSSAASQALQPPMLEEQRRRALGDAPARAPAGPQGMDTAQSPAFSAVQGSQADSQPPRPAKPAARDSGRFGVSDMAALYERKAEEGVSLAADLAAAISAVDLTDVLMDDAPFDTAKVSQILHGHSHHGGLHERAPSSIHDVLCRL